MSGNVITFKNNILSDIVFIDRGKNAADNISPAALMIEMKTKIKAILDKISYKSIGGCTNNQNKVDLSIFYANNMKNITDFAKLFRIFYCIERFVSHHTFWFVFRNTEKFTKTYEVTKESFDRFRLDYPNISFAFQKDQDEKKNTLHNYKLYKSEDIIHDSLMENDRPFFSYGSQVSRLKTDTLTELIQ